MCVVNSASEDLRKADNEYAQLLPIELGVVALDAKIRMLPAHSIPLAVLSAVLKEAGGATPGPSV